MISLGDFQAMYTLAIQMRRNSETEETANNNGDHFVNDKSGPSYPMGPLGPGPGPQASGGPQTAHVLVFISWNNRN